MTISPTFRRAGATAVAAGLVAAPLTIAPGVAVAAENCAATTPAATLVAPGICEIVFTEDGTLSGISGIDKLTAVLVGAGAGSFVSFSSYGGGAGEVVYVDDIDTTSDYVVTVGQGGIGNGESDGEITALYGNDNNYYAGGGFGPGFEGGTSGSNLSGGFADCFVDSVAYGYSGGGAGDSQAGDGNSGGFGTYVYEIEGVDASLYNDELDHIPFGHGGDGCNVDANNMSLRPGDGAPAGPDYALDGADGIVIVRFAADGTPAEEVTELAATGTSSALGGFAAAAALLAGVGALVMRRVR